MIDVAIVGAGPVGATLAALLARSGRSVQVLESRDGPSADARTLALSDASRERLEAVDGWPRDASTPITSIHVSQQGAPGRTLLEASDQGMDALGYTVAYSALERSLLVSGFPYNWKLKIEALKAWAAFVRRAQAVRRLGSAALDLCLVADGRLDGYWERGLGPWDLAAGVLIAREAGARVTGLRGEAYDLDSGDVLAANATIHRQMAAVFKTLGKR